MPLIKIPTKGIKLENQFPTWVKHSLTVLSTKLKIKKKLKRSLIKAQLSSPHDGLFNDINNINVRNQYGLLLLYNHEH